MNRKCCEAQDRKGQWRRVSVLAWPKCHSPSAKAKVMWRDTGLITWLKVDRIRKTKC